jgi:DNA-binding NarL/FixJ family response regulator
MSEVLQLSQKWERRKKNGTELSDSEERIIQFLAEGLSVGDIASAFGVKYNCAHAWVRRLRVRTNTQSDAHMVAMYLKGRLEHLPTVGEK